MANTEIFKTVFKGYNKEEVIAYIDGLNRQLYSLRQDLEAANAQLAQAEAENAASEEAEEELDKEAVLQSLREELIPALSDKLRSEIEAELRPQIEKDARKKVEEEMAAKYEEVARAEINNRIQSQSAEIQELRRRAQLYDDNREVLAELMIKAKNDAADIIKDAEAYAQTLRNDAEQRYNLLISDYELLKSNLLSAKEIAVERLNFSLKELEEFERHFSCMDQDVSLSKEHLND